MTELKPCPFCNSYNISVYDSEKAIQKFVMCNFCEARGPWVSYTKPSKATKAAIEGWNERKGEAN